MQVLPIHVLLCKILMGSRSCPPCARCGVVAVINAPILNIVFKRKRPFREFYFR